MSEYFADDFKEFSANDFVGLSIDLRRDLREALRERRFYLPKGRNIKIADALHQAANEELLWHSHDNEQSITVPLYDNLVLTRHSHESDPLHHEEHHVKLQQKHTNEPDERNIGNLINVITEKKAAMLGNLKIISIENWQCSMKDGFNRVLLSI